MVRRSEQGFTLMELMVVSAILATTVALAMPAMSSATAERKSNEIALDLVRVARQARSASTAYGRAHLLRFNSGDNGGQGGVEVYRGINNNCNTTNWALMIGGGCVGNINCITQIDPTQWETSVTQYQITNPDFGVVDICYEPTGIVRWRVPVTMATRFVADNFFGGNQIRGGFEFRIARLDGIGVVRRMLMPLGGDSRMLR